MATVIAPDTPATAPAARVTSPARITAFLSDPRRAVCAAVVVLSAAVGLDALSDPDVWWHLRLGQWILAHGRVPTGELFSYTAQGNPLVAHEWLSDAAFALLASAGGLFLLSLFMGAVAWSGLIATAFRGRLRGAGPLAIAVGLALGAKAAETVLGTRPQVFTVALLCATLLIADSYLLRGGRRRWILPALFLVWANLHAGFVVGLGFLTLTLAAELVKTRFALGSPAPSARIRGLAIATAASAVAACANPAGPLLYRFALLTTSTEGQKAIIEWQSPNFHDPGMWALLVLLLSFAALPALGGRLDIRDAVLAGAGTAMALLAVRNTAVCVAVVLPAWMSMAGDVGRRFSSRRAAASRGSVSPAAVVVGASVVAAGVLAVGYAAARVHADASPSGIAAGYPACAANALERSPVDQRVFTAYGSAGYIIYRDWAKTTVYEYGESISLGSTVFNNYQRIAAGAATLPTATQLLDQSRTTAVLYPAGELTAQLDATPGWTRVLDDHGSRLYVRGDASWTAGLSCP
jgi:hypothetical protein